MKVSINQDVVSEIADGEVVLLDLKRGFYYALDPVGSRFWGLLQSGLSLQNVRAALLDEYQVNPEQLTRDLDGLLSDLSRHGLVRYDEG